MFCGVAQIQVYRLKKINNKKNKSITICLRIQLKVKWSILRDLGEETRLKTVRLGPKAPISFTSPA